MSSIPFNLISPETNLFNQKVRMVVLPGAKGDIGVLPGHAPFVTLLRPGVVTIYEEGKSALKIFIDGGFAEVTPDTCNALVTAATPLEALNKNALELEIKVLLEDRERSQTAEARAKADKHLSIAQTKLMEVVSSLQK